MDNPLISVIVPIYKVEEYLERSVESIVNQTYKNLEIILVDDGSPDNCPKMCDDWAKKDNRIKVIHKENGGLSDARNAGLKIAKGKYIAFVDSDDWVEKNYILYLYKAIFDNNADLSACDVRIVPDGEEVTEVERIFHTSNVSSCEEALSQLIKGKRYRAVAWNKLYRREIVEYEYFEVGKLHEDEFYTYRIFDKCKRLIYVDIPLYNYRQRSGSIMAIQSIRHLDGLEASFRRLSFLKEKYPRLYKSDKITFCIGCIFSYSNACNGEYDDNDKAKIIIKKYRKRIRFSFKEFLEYSLKEKMYVILSSTLFIEVFCKFKNKV